MQHRLSIRDLDAFLSIADLLCLHWDYSCIVKAAQTGKQVLAWGKRAQGR